jgi:UDP-N-acetylmuramate--alanine ligase
MNKYENIYFIGIGGIGMSAIARYYEFKGLSVSGYDRTPSELTRKLESEGIKVHYEDNPDFIPHDVVKTLVIYTPAIPSEMNELQYARVNGYKVMKRSEILGEITRGQRCLAVAGTHGKTTTSTLTAHILTDSGKGCSAFVGGISKNYDTNLLLSHNPTVVVEADEFDRSFLRLHPEIAVITAMDADHLDIYGDLKHVREAFMTFASQVSGTVIAKQGLGITKEETNARLVTYHYDDPKADYYGSNAKPDECGYFSYDLNYPGGIIKDIKVGIPGWVNVENSIAAAAICLIYGVDPESIKKAIGTFKGVKRRMDIHVNTPHCSYIDDYAHHPKEIATAISSMRDIFPGRKLTAVFQPHLYTRTRDFAADFAASLSLADKVILLDIYPAREQPIPGVTSKIIFDGITIPEKVMINKEELMGYLEKEPIDVLVSFGAGNIDRFIRPITEMLKKRLERRH